MSISIHTVCQDTWSEWYATFSSIMQRRTFSKSEDIRSAINEIWLVLEESLEEH